MAKDVNEENELMRSIEVDEHIIKKNKTLSLYALILGFSLFLIIGLSVLLAITLKQVKLDMISRKTTEQIIMNMHKDIEKINRRTYAINDISRIALHWNPYWDEWTLNQVAQMIYDVGELRYGIPYEEFAILITLESRWKIKAKSPLLAKGLCQIMWGTAKWACGDLKTIDFEGDDTLYNPLKNVRLGLYIYKTFREKFEYVYPWYIVAYAGGEDKVYPMFLNKSKIEGEYKQYHMDWLKIKIEVEKVLGRTIDIQ